ncbi:MAG: molybdate ABC transporter substrate-binding protein [Proteobacteria bacterium]|nr:molybdate ABC transporter substrate-binding protein [Pseudomonadota bacterium]MBU1233825.1 molybdate ABC transporter substrate-binding protein [Pseudomonadota bacterium]MBU1420713.1 molybdate ABC transporter substrate-binding protein [Pseudomonadota bacterium]MBU1455028.1 molybdate ABC transporter substrate-binding protein [Pseudomonadota bacterium]
MKWKMLITVLLLQMCSIVTVQAQTINLSVAASMTNAFNELIAGFSTAHPDAVLQPNYASSGSLAKQIEQGAPADIYVSANPKWMKYLLEKGLIVKGTDRIFAYNKLVFIGEKRSADLSLDNLVSLERIALGSPQSVPAGQYAKQAMEHAGIYAKLEQERKLIMAKDVRQALLYADRGEVDGAFVYRTDARLATTAKILFTVPDDLYDRVQYPVGLTTTGTKNDQAQAFYDYLNSPEAITILTNYGFEPIH